MGLEAPIVIVGAGAAGIATALSAARGGARVILVEESTAVGGTMANAMLHTLAGLYDSDGNALNDGLPSELERRLEIAGNSRVRKRKIGKVFVLSVDPQVYRTVARQWLREEGVDLRLSSRISDVRREGQRITGVQLSEPDRSTWLSPTHVADTTGRGAVARLVDEGLLFRLDRPSAPGLVVRLAGIEPSALTFPRSVLLSKALQDAAVEGRLPSRCQQAWVDVGIEPDEIFVKLFVPLEANWRRESSDASVRESERMTVTEVARVLSSIDGCEGLFVKELGALGVRDDGGVLGEYVLTEGDVRAGRRFSDAACRCAWPIEHWDSDSGLNLEYLPPGVHYEIPLRALKAAGCSNLWTAGKSLSATPLAQASARCVGTCWAMGDAVGRALTDQRVQSAEVLQ